MGGAIGDGDGLWSDMIHQRMLVSLVIRDHTDTVDLTLKGQTALFCLVLTLLGHSTIASDPLAALSDDFTSPTMADWQRVRDVEGWPHEQLEIIDIGTTRGGWPDHDPAHERVIRGLSLCSPGQGSHW